MSEPASGQDADRRRAALEEPSGGDLLTRAVVGLAASPGGATGPLSFGEPPLHLLIVEDNPSYAALLVAMLRGVLGSAVQAEVAPSLAACREKLAAERLDCVILDLSLPDAEGLHALAVVSTAAPTVPVVVLTGREEETLALRALQEGAQDFLPKRRADAELVVRSIRYAIERKRVELRIAHQALHDPLTGLPNRILLLDRLETALARSRRNNRLLAVLFVDLDEFKAVNDALGHDAGDELLVAIAGRLAQLVRPADSVGRLGGDEFVVVCEELHGAEEAVLVAERLRARLAEPIFLRGRSLSIGSSLGIAFAEEEVGGEELVQRADAAMYRAKREGGGIALFERSLHDAALQTLELEHQLRTALARGELLLHYQPLVCLYGGPLLWGVEALLRWDHPTLGLLAPGRFVPTAEESGLIVPIGRWVIEEAIRQLARWRQEGVVPPEARLSVNVSQLQLGSRTLLTGVAEALADHEVPPDRLWLELTETAVARNERGAARLLAELQELGVRVALDDFGTGYSSLSALRNLPVRAVKLDRTFFAEAADDSRAAKVLHAVAEVVRAAGLQPVAEGIETEGQLELALQSGCTVAQGFLFARPAPPHALRPVLRSLARGRGAGSAAG